MDEFDDCAEDCDIDRWSQYDDHLAPRLNVVIGINGSGKTALLHTLLKWLSGDRSTSPSRYPRIEGIDPASVEPRNALFLRSSRLNPVWTAVNGAVRTRDDGAPPIGDTRNGSRQYADLLLESLQWCNKNNATLLIDHVERELDPMSQREMMRKINRQHRDAQLIVTTQAPLVLVSLEPWFDSDRDALWVCDFDQTSNVVRVTKEPFIVHGDVNNWLTSGLFNKRTRE